MIFEPIYQSGQQLSDAAFVPLILPDNSHAPWREFRILVDFYRQGRHKDGHAGVMSPKFGLKTKITGQQFVDFVHSRPNADVWLINPFPQLAYYSFNVWMQGEVNHPGIVERTQALLKAAGVTLDIGDMPRNTARTLCYSNFWVGTQRFWEAYVGEVLDPIARFLEANPQHPVARAVMSATWHTDSAPFLPFIVERLFSSFLVLREGWTIAAYEVGNVLDYCLTDFEREMVAGIRPMVDAADAMGEFPLDLANTQGLLCKLYKRYAEEHFATNTHPHTGRTVASA